MIRMRSEPDIVRIEAHGRLTGHDYDAWLPTLEKTAEERGPLRLYIELLDFHGWSPTGLWEDIKFDATHQDDMERIAVVGESGWQEWGTKLSRPFFKADVKFFTRDHAEEAERWLRS